MSRRRSPEVSCRRPTRGGAQSGTGAASRNLLQAPAQRVRHRTVLMQVDAPLSPWRRQVNVANHEAACHVVMHVVMRLLFSSRVKHILPVEAQACLSNTANGRIDWPHWRARTIWSPMPEV